MVSGAIQIDTLANFSPYFCLEITHQFYYISNLVPIAAVFITYWLYDL